MTDLQKKHVALQVINKKAPVTEIAKSHNVSRQFVYSQKDKAMAAVDQAFNKKDNDDEKILFHLPVTKSWIDQLVLCLMLHGRTSFRDITKVVKDVLDLDISVGRIRNIAKNAKQLAISINAQQDLSAVKLAAYDELFHHDKPVLAGVEWISLHFIATYSPKRTNAMVIPGQYIFWIYNSKDLIPIESLAMVAEVYVLHTR